MYLRTVRAKGAQGVEFEYIRLVEAYWENGHSRPPSALKRLLPPAGDRCWWRAGCGANWVWRTFWMAWRQKQTVCKRPVDSLLQIECWCWWPIGSAVPAASTHWGNGWRAILSVDVMARGLWLAGSSRVAYG